MYPILIFGIISMPTQARGPRQPDTGWNLGGKTFYPAPDFDPSGPIPADHQPFTADELQKIHSVCEILAGAFQSARGVPREQHIPWLGAQLSEILKEAHIEGGLPLEAAIVGTEKITEQVLSHPREMAQGKRFWHADGEFFDRCIRILLRIEAGLIDEFAEAPEPDPFTGPGEDESASKTILVSTTGTSVRLHHHGVGEFYEIEFDRIPDHRALMRWVHHLGQKTWVTAKTIAMFVSTVCDHRGWEMYDFGQEHNQEVS